MIEAAFENLVSKRTELLDVRSRIFGSYNCWLIGVTIAVNSKADWVVTGTIAPANYRYDSWTHSVLTRELPPAGATDMQLFGAYHSTILTEHSKLTGCLFGDDPIKLWTPET